MIIRIGKYYKVYSMNTDGIIRYYVGSIKDCNFLWTYLDKERAITKFEKIEKYAEKHGEI